MTGPSPRVADLIDRIERCCAKLGKTEQEFGQAVAHDFNLVSRLRSGGTITLRTLEKIELHLDFTKLTRAEQFKFFDAVAGGNEASILRMLERRKKRRPE